MIQLPALGNRTKRQRYGAGAAKQAKNIAIVAHGVGAKHFATV
jgi:hypothetical protein